MNRSRENLPITISADWHSPIVSATIYLRVARRGSIIADVISPESIETKIHNSLALHSLRARWNLVRVPAPLEHCRRTLNSSLPRIQIHLF